VIGRDLIPAARINLAAVANSSPRLPAAGGKRTGGLRRYPRTAQPQGLDPGVLRGRRAPIGATVTA